jgi:hypothetical protein
MLPILLLAFFFLLFLSILLFLCAYYVRRNLLRILHSCTRSILELDGVQVKDAWYVHRSARIAAAFGYRFSLLCASR